MDKRPIEGIMATTMESIRDMVDVNTVIGEPVEAGDGSTIIPVSKVSFGFVAGGGDYECRGKPVIDRPDRELPFAGGAGAGVSVQPVGFLVVNEGQVRLLPAQHYAPLDRVIELAPQLLNDLKQWITGLVKGDGGAPGEGAPCGSSAAAQACGNPTASTPTP